MTTRKTEIVPAVAEAKRNATVPKRQAVQHTKLFRAELQVKLSDANGALAVADAALIAIAGERDAAIELANQRYDAFRRELDAERDDIIRSIKGVEAALEATADLDVQIKRMEG